MALHHLASIEQIDALAAELVLPGPDVVLAGLESLREAPRALELLELHQEEDDWRALNLRQVRWASSLVNLLAKTERRLRKLGRSIQEIDTTSVLLSEASLNVWNSTCPTQVGQDGMILARTYHMCPLDVAHEEINQLLNGALAEANGGYMMSNREVTVLSNMKEVLIRLADDNRTMARRLDRLKKVVTQLEQFEKPSAQEVGHALSYVDQDLRQIAKPICASTRQLLNQVLAGHGKVKNVVVPGHDGIVENAVEFVNVLQQMINDRLAMVLSLNHQKFSGPLQIKTLRDLEEAFMVSTPHQGGVPARHVHVQLRGLKELLDADAMIHRVDEGVEQMGWTVEGHNNLTTALQLDGSLVALRTALRLLRYDDVVSPLGVVLQPDLFDRVEELAIAVDNVMFSCHGPAVCAAASELVKEVLTMVVDSMSDEPDEELLSNICNLLTGVYWARRSEVSFPEA